MIDRACEDKLYQMPKFAGAVRYNALTCCATRVCCACGDSPTCVAERYLTLRIGCERHARVTRLPFPFSKRSPVTALRQTDKQGKGRSPKRKGNRRCPFLFAPAAGAAHSPFVKRITNQHLYIKSAYPIKRICAFLRRYTAYPCTEPSPKLTASASSTCRMAFSSSEPIFSRRRRLSSVRICSVRMMESLVSP